MITVFKQETISRLGKNICMNVGSRKGPAIMRIGLSIIALGFALSIHGKR